MRTSYKVGGFAVLVAGAFAAAVGIGNAVGPINEPASPHSAGHGTNAAATQQASPQQASPLGVDMEPGGLAASKNGYTLTIENNTPPAGPNFPLQFRIDDSAGRAVTDYQVEHEKELHLIVVRRDLNDFQHVHPTRDAAGTWSVPVNLSSAGDYRVFADFAPAGADGITLGADLRVAGDYRPQPFPAPIAETTVDGYTVRLQGEIGAGTSSKVTLQVSKDGRPVTDLQPYLGAYGHLVALRASDLGYLHVHPDGAPGDGKTAAGPNIEFYVNAPSAGKYGLFLDFRHGDTVRTARFTVDIPASATTPPPASSTAPAHGGH